MADHNFNKGPISYYNKIGQYRTCYSDSEVNQAKNDGFTSKKYVKSEWPKTAFHKKTGETRVVGKLENTDEQNKAAIASLGPDWTTDYVAAVAPKIDVPQPARADIGVMADLLAEMKLINQRIEDVEVAISEFAGARTAMESRMEAVEQLLEGLAEPAEK